MRVRALAPFAAAAVIICVGSSVLVLSTARQGAVGPAAAATATPGAAASQARALPELSKTARLAFWRDGKLWVSDLDGSLRQAIGSSNDLLKVSLTRWIADGTAVSFVDDGVTLVVLRTDGRRIEVPLAGDQRAFGYRISDVRWSPDGTKAAATLLRPTDGRSDAFLADLSAARPVWERLTQLEDLFIGDWISNDELLASTALGAMGVVAIDGTNAMRLLSGVTGASPIIGPEGRIHFLVGRVPVTRDPALPFVTASTASVWSAAADGGDVKREAPWQLNDVRLDARLPDGRYLMHRGSSGAQAIAGESDLQLLPSSAGVIERVRVAPDGRSAYGFAFERIVRIDLARLATGAGTPSDAAVSVFLDTSAGSDVWFPAKPALVNGREPIVGGPEWRYAFALGGHIWQMEKGVARLLRPAPLLRRVSVPSPRWAPDGRHLALLEQAGLATTSTTLIAISIDANGDQTRLGSSLAAGRSFTWSPDGKELAIAVDRRVTSGLASDADLEIRFMDPSGAQTRSPVRGAEVAWSAAGLFVLGPSGAETAIERIGGEGERAAFVTRGQLASDPRVEPTGSPAAMSGLDAAADGSFVSIRLQLSDPSATRSYLVLIDERGRSVRYLRAEGLSDGAWSPSGGLIGYTLDARTATERAVVTAPSGEPIATINGRFAGWSPDGRWYHVARTGGLFAYPVAGGPAVRVGVAGAPVTVTAP